MSKTNLEHGISDLQKEKEKVRHAEKKYRTIFENAREGIYQCTPDEHYLSINPAMARIYGYESPEEMIDTVQSIGQQTFVTPEEWEKLKHHLAEEGDTGEIEVEQKRKDGSTFWVSVRGYEVYDEEGKSLYWEGRCIDITKRKRVEEALSEKHVQLEKTVLELEQARNMLDLIIESIPVRVFWKDRESRYLGCNSLFARDAGLDFPHELLNKDDFAMGWRDQAEMYRKDDSEVMDSGRPKMNIIEEQSTPTGSKIWLNTSKVPLRLVNGEVFGVLGVYEDITNRKLAEDALRKTHALLQNTFDATPDLLTVHNKDLKVMLSNWRGRDHIPLEERKSLPHCYACYMRRDKPCDPCPTLEVFRTGHPVSIEIENPYTRKINEVSAYPVLDSSGNFDLVTEHVRDITERKRSEELIKQSENHYRQLFELTHDGIVLADSNGHVLAANQAFCELTGRSLDWLLNSRLGDCEGETSRALVPDRIQTLESEGQAGFDVEILRPDGTQTYSEVKARMVDWFGQKAILAVVRDITDRKEMEKDLRARNEELARFVYTVSHDLKSPLVTIQTFLGYLKQDLSDNDANRITTDIGYMDRAAIKMLDLLEGLLELSRVGRMMNPPRDLPFVEMVHAALDAVAGQITERRVEIELHEAPVMLHGDRLRLTEVFQNLVDNAVKFMGDEPSPRIEIGAEEAEGEIVFYVRDNGLGIDPRHQNKLFGLFEKLHPDIPGAGMGLALIKRIIEVHGGRIWVKSAGPGQGTTFKFTLQGTRLC